jgi:hypothetical protein
LSVLFITSSRPGNGDCVWRSHRRTGEGEGEVIKYEDEACHPQTCLGIQRYQIPVPSKDCIFFPTSRFVKTSWQNLKIIYINPEEVNQDALLKL